MKKCIWICLPCFVLLLTASCGELVKDEDEKAESESSEGDNGLGDDTDDEKKANETNECLSANLDKGVWSDISSENAPSDFPMTTQGYRQRGIGVWHNGKVLYFDVNGGNNNIGNITPTLYAYSPCDDEWQTVVAADDAPSWFSEGAVTYSSTWTGNQFTVSGTKYGAENQNTAGSFVVTPDKHAWGSLDAADFPGGLRVKATHNSTRSSAIDVANNFAPIAIERFATPADSTTTTRQGIVVEVDNGFVVWGGNDNEKTYGDGKVYDIKTGTFKTMSSTGAPSPRKYAVVAAKGNQALYWGGYSGLRTDEGILVDGGIYDVDTDTWVAISGEGGPTEEFVGTGGPSGIRALWVADKLMILNTQTCGPISGFLYEIEKKQWSKIASSDFSTKDGTTCSQPLTSYIASNGKVVWTSQTFGQVIVFDPAANAWEEIAIPKRDPALSSQSAIHVWTGNSFVIWGPHKDTTDPDQCSNVSEGIGCDPAASGEYLKTGAMIRITED